MFTYDFNTIDIVKQQLDTISLAWNLYPLNMHVGRFRLDHELFVIMLYV